MATITVPDEDRTLSEAVEISDFLGNYGIWYRHFDSSDEITADASDDDILTAYAQPIQELMKEGGYRSADVINITPTTLGLEAMLNKFNKEHWHDEDEVRFVVGGRGLFHIHPEGGPVFRIEVEAGDMIKVPNGTHHWFDLCDDRTIRAIRLFQNTSGWTPRYTDSGEETGYQPMCFGPEYFPARGL